MRFPEPYYKKYFPMVVVSSIIAFILLFLPPWKTIHPANDTISVIITGSTSLQKKQQVTKEKQHVILMGDIMLSRSIGAWNKKEGYNRAFGSNGGKNTILYNPIDRISACKNSGCILLGNLESPFSENDLDKLERTLQFKANTGNIEFLTTLRGNKNNLILTLANNHLNNGGGGGLETTIKTLHTNNILHVGAGSSKEEASGILVYTGNNIIWCIAGYSYDGNGGKYGGKPLYRNKIDLQEMIHDITIMKTQLNCDIKVMMLHRGSEYHIHPNKTQIIQAHTLIDNGLDIIIGSHSHIPGKIEVYSGKYIFYSLGNAMFDQDRGISAGAQKGMDTIYDDLLGKNTVPTYIALFPELLIEKHTELKNVYTGKNNTKIKLQAIHGTRIEKGVYTGLDNKTLENIINNIMSSK